jgi:ABC-type glycerol-3-phosphate transport system substrate-binding protein
MERTFVHWSVYLRPTLSLRLTRFEVIAILGAIAAAVYFIFFAPDPDERVEEFLDKVAKEFGSYDPNKEVEYMEPPKPEEEPDLEGVLDNSVATPPPAIDSGQ